MTWHSFFNLSTLENRHLLAAYILVWAIQGGYFAWMLRQWSKTRRAR